MFRNNFTTWPLKAKVLGLVALAIDTIVATCWLVRLTKHIAASDWFTGASAVLMFIAAWCMLFSVILRESKQAKDHENTSQEKQEERH